MKTWDQLVKKMSENPDLSVIFSLVTLKTYMLVDNEIKEIFVRMPHYWSDEIFNIEPFVTEGKEVFGMLKFSIQEKTAKIDV